MNEGGRHALEIDDFNSVKHCPWPDMWEGEGKLAAAQAVETARLGSVARFRHSAHTAKKTLKHWDVQVTAILGEDGRPLQILAISRDITEEQKADEHRRMLTRELEHRIKNTQAIVGAIVHQTFRAAETKEQAKAILEGRLAALNEAHNILTQTGWLATPVKAIVNGALKPHRVDDGRFLVSGPDFQFDASPALSLSLALHELATNALKYGALSNDKGAIDISWHLDTSDPAETRFVFEWREKGGPVVSPPRRRGFGSRLIERIFEGQLEGDAGIHFDPGGLYCKLSIPVTRLQSSDAA
jgi:two-component sensor histidine kinase